MTDISGAEFDAMARIIQDLLEDHDDAKPYVRNDVEYHPGEIPPELWRAALVIAVRAVNNAHNPDPDDLNHDGHGNPVPVPQPGVFHGSMTPDPSPAAAADEARDLPTAGEVFGYPFADDDADEPTPMTGAEALDAARNGEEWAAVAGNIIGAYANLAQASRDEADREDAEHVVRISFNSGKFLVKCEAGDLFDVAETLDAANETRAAHEGGAS